MKGRREEEEKWGKGGGERGKVKEKGAM